MTVSRPLDARPFFLLFLGRPPLLIESNKLALFVVLCTALAADGGSGAGAALTARVVLRADLDTGGGGSTGAAAAAAPVG